MSDDTLVLTRRLIALDEQIELLTEQRKATAAALVASHKPGDRIMLGDEAVYKVSQRRTFDVERARQIVPAELIERATVPTLDVKALKALLPKAVIDACMSPGATFVSKT